MKNYVVRFFALLLSVQSSLGAGISGIANFKMEGSITPGGVVNYSVEVFSTTSIRYSDGSYATEFDIDVLLEWYDVANDQYKPISNSYHNLNKFIVPNSNKYTYSKSNFTLPNLPVCTKIYIKILDYSFNPAVPIVNSEYYVLARPSTCPASQNLTGALTNSEYKASGTISASATVASGANVTLRGNKVILQPSFKASLGSTFKAKIDPCAAGTREATVDPAIAGKREEVKNSFEAKVLYKIFPNPNSGTFSISFPSDEDAYDVIVSDLAGNTVHLESVSGTSQKNLELKTLASGMYIVAIKSKNGTYRSRIQIIK